MDCTVVHLVTGMHQYIFFLTHGQIGDNYYGQISPAILPQYQQQPNQSANITEISGADPGFIKGEGTRGENSVQTLKLLSAMVNH